MEKRRNKVVNAAWRRYQWFMVLGAAAAGFISYTSVDYPYYLIGLGLLLIGLVLGVWLTWQRAKAFWQAYQEQRRLAFAAVNPGEERFRAYQSQRRWMVLLSVLGIVALLPVVIIGCWAEFSQRWPWNLIFFLSLAGPGGALIAIFGSVLVRALADLGWWFVRPPEMAAAIVEYDNVLWKVIIAANEYRRRLDFIELVNIRNSQAGYEQYVLLPQGRGLYFLGISAWPWKCRLIRPFYESTGDVVNPSEQPQQYVVLRETTWNLAPDRENSSHGLSVPNTITHDPVEVRAWFFIRARVWDPLRYVYGAEFTAEATVSQILARWRAVTATQYYFKLHEGKALEDMAVEGLKIEPEIQEAAQTALLCDLGILEAIDDADPTDVAWAREKKRLTSRQGKEYLMRRPHVSFDANNSEENYQTVVNGFGGRKGAWTVWDKFGIILLDVELSDLEPADPDLYLALQAVTKARAQGAAALALAVGEAEATVERADGEARAITSRAEAWSRPGGSAIWSGDVARDVAKEIKQLSVVNAGQTGGQVASIVETVSALGGVPFSPPPTTPAGSQPPAETTSPSPEPEGRPLGQPSTPPAQPSQRSEPGGRRYQGRGNRGRGQRPPRPRPGQPPQPSS